MSKVKWQPYKPRVITNLWGTCRMLCVLLTGICKRAVQMGVQAGLILMHLLQMSTFNSTFLALLGLLGINASTAWKCFDILHHPPVNKSPILGQTDKPMQPNILSLTVIYRVRLYKSLRTQPCKDAARDSRLQDLSQTRQLFFFFFF